MRGPIRSVLGAVQDDRSSEKVTERGCVCLELHSASPDPAGASAPGGSETCTAVAYLTVTKHLKCSCGSHHTAFHDAHYCYVLRLTGDGDQG